MPKCKVYINLVLNRWNKTVDRADRGEGGSDTRKNYRNRVKYDISPLLPKLDPFQRTLFSQANTATLLAGEQQGRVCAGCRTAHSLSPSPRRSCQQNLLEQGLVDCSLSITAQIISILHSALCTVLGKSNTLKG